MKTGANNNITGSMAAAVIGKLNLVAAARSLGLIATVAFVAATFSFGSLQAQAGERPPKPGKGIVHYFAQEHMTNQGVLADATGRVSIHENGKSKGKAQDVHIDLHHLDTNATYNVSASVGQDTNGAAMIAVGEITTDARGNAVIDLRDKATGKAPAGGRGKLPLPAELEPVSGIQQISVQDTNGVVVLNADLTAPDKFEYFVKTDVSGASGAGVKGSLDLKANPHKGQLKVSASGLEARSDYSLSLNGSPVTTATSDGKGRLRIGWELVNPADAMSIQTVDLLDAGGAVVGSATMP